MKFVLWLTSVIALSGVTIVSGLAQGELSQRWKTPADFAAAKEAVVALPTAFGPWKLAEERDLTPYVQNILQCMGYLHRSYRHADSGEIVTVAVLLGPPGPISVHTPEICYSGRNYQMQAHRQPVVVRESAAGKDVFWKVALKSKNIAGTGLSVYYGWKADQTWGAPEQPRFAYLGKPFLYKIQVACEATFGDDVVVEHDACQRFLSDIVAYTDRLPGK